MRKEAIFPLPAIELPELQHPDETSQHRQTPGYFKVLASTRSAQAAMMVLPPGGETSEQPENEHPKSEQWLYVISGTGSATVAGRSIKLKEDALLLIEKGEPHRIRNTGKKPLTTLNFYAPPAYTTSGELRK